jgi:hypothetical protein
MKNFLILLMLSTSALALRGPDATIPNETIQRIQKLYPTQSEEFLHLRLKNAENAFQKWRSFPPYFYELLNRSEGLLGKDFSARQGLCAGDPHLENFGFLYIADTRFTINDLDDVAPCPLNADALRLFIGHRLISSVNSDSWLSAYKAGLAGEARSVPEYLLRLKEKSLKERRELPKKMKTMMVNKNCQDDYKVLNAVEAQGIETLMKKEKRNILIACSRDKDHGGSAGLRRYIVVSEKEGEIAAFELKPLVTPAPLYNKKLTQKEREEYFKQAVRHFFGSEYSAHYYPVSLIENLFLRRPIWKGNQEISEKDMGSSDLSQIILYEAYTLGIYHRKSNQSQLNYSSEKWEALGREIESKWKKEFAE